MKWSYTSLIIIFLFGRFPVCAQEMDWATIDSVVVRTAALFEKNYVIPEKGLQIKQYLLEKHYKHQYSDHRTKDSLLESLKEDIYSVARDKHVRFAFRDPKPAGNPEDSMTKFFNSAPNYGFKKVEVLPGRVGLLELQLFYPISEDDRARETANESMLTFRDCKAIIFDLRQCRGGSPEMLSYLMTYLYPEGEKVLLNRFYYRPLDQYTTSYTWEMVEGPRYPDTPVFVLTSATTFSCGEEFAYDIKHLKRGKIIGETTAGAANPVEPMAVTPWLDVLMPSGTAINPITQTNWEGVGVIPDIAVPADQALSTVLNHIRG